MKNLCFYLGSDGATVPYTEAYLLSRGFAVTRQPSSDVTHAIFPMTVQKPEYPDPSVTVLDRSVFLADARFLAMNAAITADCAVRLAMEQLPTTLDGISVLVLGWGRIGKCFALRMKALGAQVSIWARKEADRSMAEALGLRAASACDLEKGLVRYRLIVNTIPVPILSEEQLRNCRKSCVKIDLASAPGIAGDDVIQARGLPGKLAPESAGNLIAATAIRLVLGKEPI